MHRRRPLTSVAQEAVAGCLGAGALAIDATVGNGHDTLFLARAVAPHGRVVGFDVQPAAIAATRQRLDAAGLGDRVQLLLAGHQAMRDHLPADWPGRVGAVMFNLGYLPGGDKRIITRADSTLPALRQSQALLRAGGLISLLLYRSHSGAGDEVAAVTRWIAGLGAGWKVAVRESPGPVLYLVERLA